MSDPVPEKFDNEELATAGVKPVDDYDLFLGASRLDQDARDLRIEETAKFDAIAYRLTAMAGLVRTLLVERGRQDMVDQLNEMNRPSDLPGVRSLPLE